MTINIYSPDLADYVEGLSYNQIVIALECAINTIVSATVNDPTAIGYNQLEEEIRDNALVHLELSADPLTVQLLGYDEVYDNLVNKLAVDISSDSDSPDVQVLQDEMIMAKWVRVINHLYTTPQDILRLTIEFDYNCSETGAVSKDEAVLSSWGLSQ